jgi:feruloyl esterase
MKWPSILAAGALIASMSSAVAAAVDLGKACDKLVSLTIPNVQIRSATAVPAGLFEPYVTVGSIVRGLLHLGGGPNSLTVPEFCRIKATARPVPDSEINFELWIPPSEKWNGKLQGIGNAAWWGGLMYADMARALRQGYATAGNDTGHSGDDLRFGLGHPEKVIDYAYRAVHVMTETAKLLIRIQTGRFAEHSYFVGCSTGGHQGLSEAQRYPEDYDGIIAGSPNNDRVRLIFGYLWSWMAAHPNGDLVLPAAKLRVVTKAVVEACDAIDGLKDGLVDDPRACRFDAATLLCKGADNADCLSAAQVEAVRKIHGGLKDPRTGKQILAGWALGSEDIGDQGWRTYIVDPPEPTLVQVLRYFLFDDPTWDWNSIQWNRDPSYAEEKLGFLPAIAPDLTPFEHHGGKLLMSTGWSDPLIPPEDIIGYYEAVMNASGGPVRTLKFARLFMAPGMGHCGGGPGPNQFDALTALDDWVTKGHAPDQLIASHTTDGKVDRSRPLCPYPQVAQFKGHGSIDDSMNFVCVEKPSAPDIGTPATRRKRIESKPERGRQS